MDQTLTIDFPNKISIRENSKFEKNQFFFIPQNTTVFTREMIRQFSREQRVMQKELERYDSWINIIRFSFIRFLGRMRIEINHKK